jgi:hypothetical protein
MWYGYRNAGGKYFMGNYGRIWEKFFTNLPDRKKVRFWKGICSQTMSIC